MYDIGAIVCMSLGNAYGRSILGSSGKVISAFVMLRQEGHEFEVSLGCTIRPCLKNAYGNQAQCVTLGILVLERLEYRIGTSDASLDYIVSSWPS